MLANAEAAFVDDDKLFGYLLNPLHKDGGPKGQFLIQHGFDPDRPEVIRAAILGHGRTQTVGRTIHSAFGVKFEVNGPMETPSGRSVIVRTVWHIDTGQTAPRFVTLKPL